MALPDGLYDLLLTEGLTRSLAALDPISADVLALKGGAAEFLADVITRQLATILDDVAGDGPWQARGRATRKHSTLRVLWVCRCWPIRSMVGMSRRQALTLSPNVWSATLPSPRSWSS
jgi:hypothetical protein